MKKNPNPKTIADSSSLCRWKNFYCWKWIQITFDNGMEWTRRSERMFRVYLIFLLLFVDTPTAQPDHHTMRMASRRPDRAHRAGEKIRWICISFARIVLIFVQRSYYSAWRCIALMYNRIEKYKMYAMKASSSFSSIQSFVKLIESGKKIPPNQRKKIKMYTLYADDR